MVGRRFGRFRVEEELGRGDFGFTCRARAIDAPEHDVVLKLAHAQLCSDDLFRALLERECTALADLRHPGIASFLGIEREGDQLGGVRAYVHGYDLGAVLAQGPVPAEQVPGLLELALRALDHAHQRRIVHGDLSPANLFWCHDGSLRITDFGFARAVHAAAANRGGLAGHPDYMAPELAASQLSPRADLYALGLITWECLTGRHACDAAEPGAKLDWHRYRGISDPRGLCPQCPDWLARLLLQLAAIDPATRPRDAAQALTLLRPSAAPRVFGAQAAEPAAAGEVPTASFEAPTTSSGLVPPPPPERTPPAPPRLDRPAVEGAMHAGAAQGFGGDAFGGGYVAPPSPPPPASPTPTPSVVDHERGPILTAPPALAPVAAPHRPRATPRAAPGEVVDPKTERLKVAVFWSVSLGVLLVSVVAFVGYRTMEARRLAAARASGPDIDPELLLGGGYDRFGEPLPDDDASRGTRRVRKATGDDASANAPGASNDPGTRGQGEDDRYLLGGADGGENAPVSFSSNPIGARVWLDNKEIGHTPIEGLSLREGRHVVRLELDGYAWASRELKVERGVPIDLGSIPMEREVVSAGPVLLWSVTLEGEPVFVDGASAGRLPVIVELTPAEHDFFVQPSAGEPVELRLRAYPGTADDPGRLQLEAR